MRLTTTLLAGLAATALGLVAVPGVAEAYEFDLPANSEFTIAGGELKLTTAAATVACTSVTGSGQFENLKTGPEKATLHAAIRRDHCKSTGKANGEVESTMVKFHTGTYIDDSTHISQPMKVTTTNAGNPLTMTALSAWSRLKSAATS